MEEQVNRLVEKVWGKFSPIHSTHPAYSNGTSQIKIDIGKWVLVNINIKLSRNSSLSISKSRNSYINIAPP